MKDINRIKGALFGVAVGDALGAPAEFMSAEEIKREHGTIRDMIGGGWLNVKPGEVTDDTQMTLAVAKGICENPDSPIEAIGRHFVHWAQSGPKDIGNTCHASILTATRLANDTQSPSARNWFDASLATHNAFGGQSAGNGSLMRTVYVGLYYNDQTTVSDMAEAISRMTHHDASAAAACAAYSLMVYKLIRSEETPRECRWQGQAIIRKVADRFTHLEARYGYDRLVNASYNPFPSGYVVDSFTAALHCVYTTRSFKDSVEKAVNLGGDADTIAAITGGLAGAIYGVDSIPASWLSALGADIKNDLFKLAEQAANH